MKNQAIGIVYVLTNPAMPGLVKIGRTARENVSVRLNELYSTGVPVPFDCAFAGKIADESDVELASHRAFDAHRVNPRREFFRISPEQAVDLLKLMVIEDVTPQLQAEANSVDVGSKEGAEQLRARRPRPDFFEMGIPEGSILQFSDGRTVCTVSSQHKVEFSGKDYSLSALTREILHTDKYVHAYPKWTFEGNDLMTIYYQTYDANLIPDA